MGIGTLGFQKGFAKNLYDSIDARDQAEIELKKQKDLEKFRADYKQQLEMKEATTFQTLKKGDGTYETVGFSKQGVRVNSRAATSAEVKVVEDADKDREYTLSERKRKAKSDDQSYRFAEEDQAMQRKTHVADLAYKAAATAASNRSNRSSSLDGSDASGSGGSSGSAGVADLLLKDYSKDIQDVGLTTDQARSIAMRAVTTLLGKGIKDPDALYENARLSFESGLSEFVNNMMKHDRDSGKSTYGDFRSRRFSLDGSKDGGSFNRSP